MTKLTHRYTQALDQARVLFDGDVRKGTDTPYLSHLLSVSAIVLEHGGSEDQAIAALLHDAGEDKGGKPRIESIRAEFGDAVADIVAACSDSLLPEGAPKQAWWPRKVGYLENLARESSDVALVSAADKVHNARSILGDYRKCHESLWERFTTGRVGTLWYYRKLVDILPSRLDRSAPDLGDLLRRTVHDLCDDVRDLSGADLDAEFAEACELERAARK